MAEEKIVLVCLAIEKKVLSVSYPVGSTAEDLCIKVSRQIGIGPVAKHLFALRNKTTRFWFAPSYKLPFKDKTKYEFRLRFKPTSIQQLKYIDPKAYDYYFHQARCDVLENKVPDIVYEKHKRELIGLGICDMYRVMLEKNVPSAIVESEYKKYIPKECLRRHSFFVKKPIHNALSRISGHDALYVKEQYLNQFASMAPKYPYEEYNAFMDRAPEPLSPILLRVNASEVKYCEVGNNTMWTSLCAIEDLCFLSIREDSFVEISHKNGIPWYLKFSTNELMSFVSALDGYYRLAVKWTFNLCRDFFTPSLEQLHKQKCHGPVGGEFSYTKLKEKRSNRPGTYILRESETQYNVFYLDLCGKDGKARTHKIEQRGPENFVLSDTTQTYKSLAHLIACHQDPEGSLYLSECLPPSEYDKSPLLICATGGVDSDVAAEEEFLDALLEGGPRCIPSQQLQIYKGKSFPKHNDSIDDYISPTVLYRAMWRVAKGKKLEVAIKVMREKEGRASRELLELIGKWGQLRSGALVRLYGLTVTPTIGMLMEFIKLGPLDAYLRKNLPQTVKTVDLVEAAACLATALWHLEENGVVHGNIRCHKLLVHVHTHNKFIVKLADPGLSSYTSADIHWLPPEYYSCPEFARKSTRADVWALGTTLWQIFSHGASPPLHRDIDSVKEFYISGKRLSMPSGCPTEIYKLMTECWGDSNGPQKQPQAIMRDINQVLYQVYNSRRTHAYATLSPKLSNNPSQINYETELIDNSSLSDCESRANSLLVNHSSLHGDDSDESNAKLIEFNPTDHDAEEELFAYFERLVENKDIDDDSDEFSNGEELFVNRKENELISNCGRSGDTLRTMQAIFELDDGSSVILQGMIGQGFYGEVYRGTMERKDNESQQVAVKKLKTHTSESDLQDFEREIAIMKTLKHPNVVKILGVSSDPKEYLVMEFVKHGSLQSYLAIHRESLTHKKLLGFSLDIATGMEYLGQQNIVHRDLAARNILVADETKVKISDFGLAQVTGKNDYYILQTNRDLPIKWYAPESLRDGKFSSKSDVWSFGVTMYETFGLGEDPKLLDVDIIGEDGKKKEESGAELLSALEKGVRLPCPPNCPKMVYFKLMHSCWHLQSHERPDFTTLCENIRDLMTNY